MLCGARRGGAKGGAKGEQAGQHCSGSSRHSPWVAARPSAPGWPAQGIGLDENFTIILVTYETNTRNILVHMRYILDAICPELDENQMKLDEN